MNCNVCGSANLVEGSISAGGNVSVYTFAASDESFFKEMLGVGGRGVHSYACIHCGNLQFTVDFKDEDKRQYLEFESQQPGVAEDSDVLGEKLETKE
jgi:predicted nucleic-acid-binding Zn-ribbon protein